MENEATQQNESLQVVVGKNNYVYTIRPFTVTNTLGFIRAVLHEYHIVGDRGDEYVLYRTKEGSWYDLNKANPDADTTLLMALKIEIDTKEKRVY